MIHEIKMLFQKGPIVTLPKNLCKNVRVFKKSGLLRKQKFHDIKKTKNMILHKERKDKKKYIVDS